MGHSGTVWPFNQVENNQLTMLETASECERSNIVPNETSSLRLPAGYSITLYDFEEGWWRGEGKHLYSEDSSLCINLPPEWNDKVASLDMWKGQVY